MATSAPGEGPERDPNFSLRANCIPMNKPELIPKWGQMFLWCQNDYKSIKVLVVVWKCQTDKHFHLPLENKVYVTIQPVSLRTVMAAPAAPEAGVASAASRPAARRDSPCDPCIERTPSPDGHRYIWHDQRNLQLPAVRIQRRNEESHKGLFGSRTKCFTANPNLSDINET